MRPIFEFQERSRIAHTDYPVYFIKYTGASYAYFDEILHSISLFNAKNLQLNTNIEIITVVQFGLNLLNENRIQDASRVVYWLIEGLEFDSSEAAYLTIWRDKTEYRRLAPWVSGMVQGQLLSLFSRYIHLSGKCSIVKKAVDSVFKSFENELSSNKRKFVREISGRVWFEEYPSDDNVVLVLNGHIFTVMGLIDYSDLFRGVEAKLLVNRCLGELSNAVKLYCKSGWSLYDLYKKNYTTLEYHWLHISQLRALHFISGDDTFKAVADIWEANITRYNIIYFQIRMRLKQIVRKIKAISL